MIKKEREIPIRIQKLEALQRRLPPSHPKVQQIKEDYLKAMAGYRGEQSIDYYLSLLNTKKYTIFHDIRLPFKDTFFQIDTIIMTPYYILLLEVKNISGTLYFDEKFQQLIRTVNGKEEAFPDPLTQVNRQTAQMMNWLSNHKISPVPVESLIIISSPYTIIKASNHSTLQKKVIHSANLLEKINVFEKVHQHQSLTNKELKKISTLLIKNHEKENLDILKKYDIHRSELLNGVHCPKCLAIPMQRLYSAWKCQSCQAVSKEAHIYSLNDYAHLVKTTISNRESGTSSLFHQGLLPITFLSL
ncbi:nuclease-related domain-containing protein [Rossellomorea sp. BNER]|uniref:nuclease-related domain-containing protein n=1 Tax=Rossellomorea sp. BNER TaxID=2962031 RepID=UPI003AF21809|nr:NERD domain-containing protein [Rossellomorea sp. BNER]